MESYIKAPGYNPRVITIVECFQSFKTEIRRKRKGRIDFLNLHPSIPDEMIKITLPDGSVKEMNNGASPLDVALEISEGLARNVLAAEVNGEVRDAFRPFDGDAKLKLLTWNDDDGKSTMWHSSAHLMAEALE